MQPAPESAGMKLAYDEISGLATQLREWKVNPERGGTLTREFLFHDFAQAFAFMSQVAVFADKRDHHPEWSNVYNRVAVTLTTHDVAGLSTKDFALASFMDQIAAALATQAH